MERREMLGGLGAAAVFALAGRETMAADAAHAHHHASPKTAVLVEAVSDCIVAGEACLAHCIVLLGDGDRSVAGCAKSVSETLALCEALRRLAAQGGKQAAAVARIAATACDDCEKECRKHEAKHAECKACAVACADCAKECRKFAA